MNFLSGKVVTPIVTWMHHVFNVVKFLLSLVTSLFKWLSNKHNAYRATRLLLSNTFIKRMVQLWPHLLITVVIPDTWAWFTWHTVDDVSVSRWDQVGGGGGAAEDGRLRIWNHRLWLARSGREVACSPRWSLWRKKEHAFIKCAAGGGKKKRRR